MELDEGSIFFISQNQWKLHIVLARDLGRSSDVRPACRTSVRSRSILEPKTRNSADSLVCLWDTYEEPRETDAGEIGLVDVSEWKLGLICFGFLAPNMESVTLTQRMNCNSLFNVNAHGSYAKWPCRSALEPGLVLYLTVCVVSNYTIIFVV